MQAEPSEFYPPRAPWYSGIITLWFRAVRAVHLDAIRPPVGFSVTRFIVGFLVPGDAFFVSQRRILGWCFLGGYILAAALFVVALGYPAGEFGFVLMISFHASSMVYLEGLWLRSGCRFRVRLALAGVTLLVVWLAVYLPLIGFVQRHWIMPLHVRGEVLVIRTYAVPDHLKRGNWVLCPLPAHELGDAHRGGGAIRMNSGYAWGPVLGLPGDEVLFSTNAFSVNGIKHPLLPHMPISGRVVLGEKHWFVWPELETRTQGNVSEANISAVMLALATVSRIDFAGQPFKYWCGRRQRLP